MPDIETIIRTAIQARMDKPKQAQADLNRVVEELAVAISKITDDKIRLQLDPLKSKNEATIDYALVLNVNDEEKILCVISISESGYPMTLWETYSSWDRGSTFELTKSIASSDVLRKSLEYLYNSPLSPIVRIITNLPSANGVGS